MYGGASVDQVLTTPLRRDQAMVLASILNPRDNWMLTRDAEDFDLVSIVYHDPKDKFHISLNYFPDSDPDPDSLFRGLAANCLVVYW